MGIMSSKQLVLGVLALSALIVAACSSVQISREASAPARPAWIDTLPRQSGMFYFVGISVGADTEAEGREAAMKDALAKIAGLMSAKVQSRSDDLLTETMQHIRRHINTKSSATVRGAYETDSYFEKTIRMEKNIRLEKYDVYVLVGISQEKVAAEIETQRRETARRTASANDLYIRGQKLMEQRSYAEAKKVFSRASKLLEGLEDVVVLPDGTKDNRQLVLLLNAELQKASGYLKRVYLSVRADGAFHSVLASVLSEKGYAITQEHPAVEISGGVSVTEGGSVWGGWVMYAEGSMMAVRQSDGRVIATFPVRGMGMHRNRSQAIADALDEAAENAGKYLADKLDKAL